MTISPEIAQFITEAYEKGFKDGQQSATCKRSKIEQKVKELKERNPHESLRSIGRQCGIDHKRVKRILSKV